jgi:hypothetical protein
MIEIPSDDDPPGGYDARVPGGNRIIFLVGMGKIFAWDGRGKKKSPISIFLVAFAVGRRATVDGVMQLESRC